ncbi:hypothetical protein RB195_018269 [Necator americanus]|uniref:Uncharacterized protein n=1 Tax=Necator americanus TaxID=51031 RepID=A0ABR1CCL2_NECAM
MMEKNICYRQRRRKEVVYDDCVLEDSSSQGDWYIEEDPNVDYEMLLRGLRAWAERASKPPHDKLGSNFEDHQGIVGEKKGFEAEEDSGSSTKKNETKEVPRGSPQIYYSASSIAERGRDSHVFSS